MTEPATPTPPDSARLEFKAALLMVLMVLLIVASAAYLMYARGSFEPTQQLVLIAEDAEGVMVGMDLSFSGFPIGRVRRIELGAQGNARIVIDVPRRDAHWLRTSSVFTLVRGLVGNTALRAYSGVPDDPPLPDGAERQVLAGDATAEIPRLLSSARELLQNLNTLTAEGAPLAASLGHVEQATKKLGEPGGALGLLFGNETDARKLTLTLDRTNALLARVDGLAAKADAQVFGAQGLLPETRAAVVQLNAILADAHASLKKVDAVLVDAQAIATNTRVATNDLGALRAEVEASLRKVEHLVDEVNRKWPFARDTELKLR